MNSYTHKFMQQRKHKLERWTLRRKHNETAQRQWTPASVTRRKRRLETTTLNYLRNTGFQHGHQTQPQKP